MNSSKFGPMKQTIAVSASPLTRVSLAFLCALLVIAAPTRAEDKTLLTAIEHIALPNGKVQIDIRSTGALDQPRIFRTSGPDRIVLDFFGAGQDLKSPMIDVDRGAVDNVLVAEDDQRSRVVINLNGPAAFSTDFGQNRLTLVVDPPAQTQASAAAATSAAVSNPNADRNLTSVDFRRTPDAVGRVILEFDGDDALIDVRKRLGEIVMDISGARIDKALQKRLDVVDFATPVQFVDAFATKDGVRVVVVPFGEFDFASLQSGNRFTLEVSAKPTPSGEGAQGKSYSGKLISFDFQNISVRSALQQIAQETDLNFVISDSVDGEMSLRLKDVPWDQALDTIMLTRGLMSKQDGNVIWIAPAAQIKEQDRLELEATLQSTQLEPLVSDLIQVNYAKAEDLASLLKSVQPVVPPGQRSIFGNVSIAEIQTDENRLLSERGSVTVDKRTNTLLIQDTAGKIREIRKLVAQLDRPVKQVLIETRIVEAKEDFSRNLGVKLGLSGINSNTSLGTAIGSGNVASTQGIRTNGISTGGGQNALGVNLPATSIDSVNPASYALTLAKAGAGWAALIDLEISALEAEGNGKIVANPRLLTADKQEAHIEQGVERIFTVTNLELNTVETKKAVLGLTVTPQITPDNKVILDVYVTKDSFVDAVQPNIDTLKVQTQVLLDNGETVVLGGIYEQTTSESVSKVPVLGDLPFLGPLFRTKGILDNRSELLIFLTPRIVNPVLTSG